MSELEEPPAKVLKIDNIDGVTHVTEISGFPVSFGAEDEMMGEESGIITGGADIEQEEWLSEGILTDDDYNTASQETIEDRTDSQLGTEDEEHLDSTLDSEANVAENEAHLDDSEANCADSEANLADSEANFADSEANFADSEANLADSEAHLTEDGENIADSEAHLADYEENIADTEAHLGDNEVHLADNEAHLTDSEAHLADSEVNLAESEVHIADSEVHLADSELHLADSELHLANSEANLDDTEANLDDSEAHIAHVDENIADGEANITECEANYADSEAQSNDIDGADTMANGAQSEADLVENEANLAEESVHVAKSRANVENEDNLMEIELNNSLENGTHIADSEADTNMTEANALQNDTNQEIMEESVKHLLHMSTMDTDMDSQTYNQEYPTKIDKVESKVKRSGIASDIVIQRVITLNKSFNVKRIESTAGQNIEETMKHLDGEKDEMKSDDIERFLTKNTVAKPGTKPRAEKLEDDGNDTDYLLRMLGEDNNKGKKKLTKTANIRKADQDGSSDDEDFIFEGTSASMRNLKAAKNAIAKKVPIKAEPEDMDDGDDETEISADETKSMQNMFGRSSKSILTRRPQKASPNTVVKRPPILNVIEKPRNVKPTRQYQNKRLIQSRVHSILKPRADAAHTPEPNTPFKSPEVKASAPFKSTIALQNIEKKVYKGKKSESIKINNEPERMLFEPRKYNNEPGKVQPLKVQPGKVQPLKTQPGKVQPLKVQPEKIKVGEGKMNEPEEIIDEEEFLDDEDFGLDEDEFAESDTDVSHSQRTLRPEREEEAPSDGGSASEDGSLYDELPSSESDDMEDWFTLDIRSEKAGDYIPLLGPKAKDLLLEEKRRVSARLTTLRQSHSALIASGQQQAAALRSATATLAELDDMLRAA